MGFFWVCWGIKSDLFFLSSRALGREFLRTCVFMARFSFHGLEEVSKTSGVFTYLWGKKNQIIGHRLELKAGLFCFHWKSAFLTLSRMAADGHCLVNLAVFMYLRIYVLVFLAKGSPFPTKAKRSWSDLLIKGPFPRQAELNQRIIGRVLAFYQGKKALIYAYLCMYGLGACHEPFGSAGKPGIAIHIYVFMGVLGLVCSEKPPK